MTVLEKTSVDLALRVPVSDLECDNFFLAVNDAEHVGVPGDALVLAQ